MSTKQQLSIAIVGSAFLALATGGAAQAALLGTETFTSQEGVSDVFSSGLPVTLGIGPVTSRGPATTAPLFRGTTITPSDLGRTFTATQETDPNFNAFAAFLTDGNPHTVSLAIGPGPYGSGSFQSISGALFDGNPSLLGNIIDSIDIQVNSLTLDTPGTNPNGNGIWTDISYNLTVNVEGHPVPESNSALGVLALAAFGAAALLRRKHANG